MSSTVRKIGVASLIMMGSVLLSRVIGLLREMVIAHMGGTGGAVDAYQVAFIIPEILNHVLASGFLSVTFIPLFSGYVMEGRENKGFELCNAILTVFGTLLVVLTLLAMVFAPQLISWVAPGLKNSELTAATVRMTRIIIPAQLFFFIGGLFSAIQFAREKFMLPALAPLIYNAGIIIGGILLGPRLGMEGFSWGVLGGSFFGNFLLQFLGSRRLGYRFKWNFNLRHENLKKYVLLTLPLMLGVTMMFSTEVFI
ncbi:MAG: murein biosynthesis integral membrane protein MurJ, partial [Proteobacteria bacterium]|nr:murein biosynthesis integral membrane protein MurJ [Pseudomonadota bacterium]